MASVYAGGYTIGGCMGYGCLVLLLMLPAGCETVPGICMTGSSGYGTGDFFS